MRRVSTICTRHSLRTSARPQPRRARCLPHRRPIRPLLSLGSKIGSACCSVSPFRQGPSRSQALLLSVDRRSRCIARLTLLATELRVCAAGIDLCPARPPSILKFALTCSSLRLSAGPSHFPFRVEATSGSVLPAGSQLPSCRGTCRRRYHRSNAAVKARAAASGSETSPTGTASLSLKRRSGSGPAWLPRRSMAP